MMDEIKPGEVEKEGRWRWREDREASWREERKQGRENRRGVKEGKEKELWYL